VYSHAFILLCKWILMFVTVLLVAGKYKHWDFTATQELYFYITRAAQCNWHITLSGERSLGIEHKVEGPVKLFALRCVHNMLVSACYVLSVCYFKGLNLTVWYIIIVPCSYINSDLPRKSVCKSSEAVNEIWKL